MALIRCIDCKYCVDDNNRHNFKKCKLNNMKLVPMMIDCLSECEAIDDKGELTFEAKKQILERDI